MIDSILKDSIKQWYEEELFSQEKKANYRTKSLFRYINIFMGMVVFFAIISLLYLILYWLTRTDFGHPPIDREEYDEILSKTDSQTYQIFTTYILAIVADIAVAFIVYIQSWENINAFKTSISERKIFLLEKEAIPMITKAVERLTSEMSISFTLVHFWGSINQSKFPSIEEDGDTGNIHVLIPANFIIYFDGHPQEGEAILAHELGHIMQKDTDLYLKCDAYFQNIRNILLPLTIINLISIVFFIGFKNNIDQIIASPAAAFALMISIGLPCWIIYYLYNGFNELRESRRISEMLADTASVIYSNGSALVTVLSSLPESEVLLSTIHPDRNQRLKHINDLLNPESNDVNKTNIMEGI